MSVYGYIVCDPCELSMWLGKYIQPSDDQRYFHIGAPGDPLNAQRQELTRALWKFLADHTGHAIRVVRDDDADFDVLAGYREIGGGGRGDIAFADYLQDWPG